jgi:hypothetical protein
MFRVKAVKIKQQRRLRRSSDQDRSSADDYVHEDNGRMCGACK